MSFASEFREFAVKGNVVDLAVGVIIGAAFGKIVDSLVTDLVMPVIAKFTGGISWRTQVGEVREAVPGAVIAPAGSAPRLSFSEAARKATPSVVNISATRQVKRPRNPLLEDPAFQRFFGDRIPSETQMSLGS